MLALCYCDDSPDHTKSTATMGASGHLNLVMCLSYLKVGAGEREWEDLEHLLVVPGMACASLSDQQACCYIQMHLHSLT